MKKTQLLIFALIATISLLSMSCVSFEKKAQKKGYCKCADTVKIIVHDTTEKVVLDSTSLDTIILNGDSMLYEVYLECDSNKNVIIKENSILKGENLELYQKFKNGHLEIKVIYKDRMVFVPRHFRSESKEHTADAKETIVQDKTKYKSVFWTKVWKFFGWSGIIAWLLIILYIVYRIYIRRYLKVTGNRLIK
jgi:hypothetical protein